VRREELEEDLRRALGEVPALDHHAHLLAGPEAGYGLLHALTESDDPEQVEQVRDHPAYRRALRELGALLEVEPTEEGVAEARARLGFEGYVRRLLAASGIEEVLVDDGFRFPGALSLEATAGLAGLPVRRVVRLETAAEEAARAVAGEGHPTLGAVRDRLRAELWDALDRGAAGVKTIAAYRGGLDLPPPDEGEARAAFSRWVEGAEVRRLAEPALVSVFLHDALELLRADPRPLQVHTGFGDRDLSLPRSNPALLRPLLEDEHNRRVPVVLLHCYPFVREASYLASVYPNVHFDLSLALTFASHRAPDLLLEALDLAPATKLLFATDAARVPELFFLGARWWRDGLARALGGLVDRGDLGREEALRWGELVLRGNARRLYG
jgi:hypothetical protein